MALDVDRLRAETPGCANLVHFDNAGGSLVPRTVHAAVVAHLEREAVDGVYAAARTVAEDIDDTYVRCAQLVGCDPDEIAMTDSATRAWALAFSAVDLGPGDQIITSRSEYASNFLGMLHLQRTRGFEIVTVGTDASGQLDLEAFEAALAERAARLVVLTHVPTNGGLVQPAAEVARLCRSRGVPLLLDACQSAGQVDLRQIEWDMLAITGRKYLRGPRGTGFLAVRRPWIDRLVPVMIDLHGAQWTGEDSYALRPDAKRFELFERSVAGMLGLRAAARYALDLGLDALEARISMLAALLRARLAEIEGVTVHDQGRRRCGIVTFTLAGIAPEALRERLHAARINVSISHRDSTLLDMTDRGLTQVLRASVHAYNTEAEIERFTSIITWG